MASNEGSREHLLGDKGERTGDVHVKPGYNAINDDWEDYGASNEHSENKSAGWGGCRGSGVQAEEDGEGDEYEKGNQPDIKVFKRRWYILFLYSMVAATQGGVWNAYGPISSTVEDLFGWKDATIALLSNWGPIAYLLAGGIFSWMMDVKGLRISCLVAAVFVAAGTGIKCITFQTPAVTWLTHTGQLLNGLAGPVAMAAPPILSSIWFPPHERTTATAIGNIFNALGVGISFVMGPLIAPYISTANSTANASTYYHRKGYVPHVGIHDLPSVSQLFQNNTGAGWSALVLVFFLVYFPSKPPLPPCTSASIQREDFLKGLKHLLTRGQFWLVALIYGLSLGTFSCWGSVLDVILKPYGIKEEEAGWIGFYATCSSCAAGLIVARFADFFKRFMKWGVFIAYVVGTMSCLCFALLTVDVLPSSNALFYTTIIISNCSLNAAVPLLYELACELSYPTGEGTTNGILTTINNVFGLIFLFIMMIPGIGHEWTNWMIVGTSGACLPLLLLMKEKYNRLEIDEHNPSLSAQIIVHPPQQ